uniref:Uncharacterized protein n=1 Tax=Clastoptera arizonana TaxID=38151 RepID=A0A1B6BZB6_9HEMI
MNGKKVLAGIIEEGWCIILQCYLVMFIEGNERADQLAKGNTLPQPDNATSILTARSLIGSTFTEKTRKNQKEMSSEKLLMDLVHTVLIHMDYLEWKLLPDSGC